MRSRSDFQSSQTDAFGTVLVLTDFKVLPHTQKIDGAIVVCGTGHSLLCVVPGIHIIGICLGTAAAAGGQIGIIVSDIKVKSK